MTHRLDELRLDDPAQLRHLDADGMLRRAASSAAEIRIAVRAAEESRLDALAREGRPRALLLAGSGSAALVGGLLAALLGPGCPVPVSVVTDGRLPGWAGVDDLVVAVSRTGRTSETLAVAAEAVRRGSRLLAVAASDSPLAALAERSRGAFVPADAESLPRAALWGLAVPVLVAAARLGVLDSPPEVFEAAAVRLEEVATACRLMAESFVNPAKTLALELADTLPVVWGTSALTTVAARRFVGQLAENAKYPALCGELPDAGHAQIGIFDGPLGSGAWRERDLFADPPADGLRGLRLVVLHDVEEQPHIAAARAAAVRLAEDRGLPVTQLAAQEGHPVTRLAGLIGTFDYASAYLALAYGMDPAPTPAAREFRSEREDRPD
ncbi:SIS domain-containing protein [Allonocardiopsis opalescens]|uniref:Glucose/mannose-6-phosphate isomerase n=1 Tax=Allonocardiopsis opalescens TaxID=1144618 RepID=A0A2T0QC58_9ACTN|nr:SIS domain-containing protein [Allonocardiopsis opalescens]PRY01499.1 glucose/mannose-6-phosphate isomerase [Allonocardiopsis opalescens]